MTDKTGGRTQEIKERLSKATPGLWDLICYPHGGGRIHIEDSRTLIADVYQTADREFLMYSKSDITFLLSEIERLREAMMEASRIIQSGSPIDNLSNPAEVLEAALQEKP